MISNRVVDRLDHLFKLGLILPSTLHKAALALDCVLRRTKEHVFGGEEPYRDLGGRPQSRYS